MRTTLHNLRRARWASVLAVVMRLLLGFAFLPAGLKKVLGQPFTDPANTGPFHEFLHAFYATGFFYRFVGGVQLMVALLLMTQTYGALGAALAVPLFVAITVLCWSTGALFTGVMTTLMLAGALALCVWDYEAWRGLLAPARAQLDDAGAGARAEPAPPVDLALWRRCGFAVLALYLGSCVVSGGVYRPRGVELSNPAFYVFPLIALVPVATWLVERRRRR
jgi:uncharacterized membrane protein YphA (DoxX/SURF4 family)